MKEKRRLPAMLIPTIVMGLLAVIFVFISYQNGVHIQGLKASWSMLIQVLPLLVFAFIVAGIVPYLVPQEMIAKWVGVESGFRGILIGSVVGGLMPGGPFVSMPLAAGLLRVGASTGTMVAFLTGWSLLAFTRWPLEIGILGWKFWLIRLVCTFFFPPIAGLIANTLFPRTNII